VGGADPFGGCLPSLSTFTIASFPVETLEDFGGAIGRST